MFRCQGIWPDMIFAFSNCTGGYADRFTPHQYLPLEEVASSVGSELSKLSKRLDAELESYAKEEKMAWLKEDDVEERCDTLTQYVTQVAARLVSHVTLWKCQCSQSVSSYE